MDVSWERVGPDPGRRTRLGVVGRTDGGMADRKQAGERLSHEETFAGGRFEFGGGGLFLDFA